MQVKRVFNTRGSHFHQILKDERCICEWPIMHLTSISTIKGYWKGFFYFQALVFLWSIRGLNTCIARVIFTSIAKLTDTERVSFTFKLWFSCDKLEDLIRVQQEPYSPLQRHLQVTTANLLLHFENYISKCRGALIWQPQTLLFFMNVKY